MIFTCNTKPLITAVSQAVVDSNINKFYRKSNLLQITATANKLTFNTEASYIMSEAIVNGMCDIDGNEAVTIFVDAMQFKKLISTFTADSVSFEYADNALIIRCGKSKFSIPKLVDENDVALNRPSRATDPQGTMSEVSAEKWRFIKNRQMFAVSENPTYPVYRYVWFSEKGEVLTGDYNKSLFTRSNTGDLTRTCLLSPTVINLINNLPEGAKLFTADTDYVIYYTCDTYTFVAQFSPQYESEEFGVYSGDIILDMCSFSDENSPIKLDCDAISRFINQIDILNSDPEAKIWISVGENGCRIYNSTSEIVFDSTSSESYEVEFKLKALKPVIANYSGEVSVYPVIQDGVTTAIKLVDDLLVTLIGANE